MPLSLSCGTVVGGYVLVEPIDPGSSGVAFSAYDPALDRSVALRFVSEPARGPDDPRTLARARKIAKVSHPNVLAVHDTGVFRGRPWVAVELVDGPSLAQWLSQQPRHWRAVVQTMVPVAEALSALHTHGVLHGGFGVRSAKVASDGRVVLVDAVTSQPVGLGRASRETDQAAFFATLWRALYGAEAELGTARPPVGGSRHVPRWLQRVCERGLAEAPTGRYADMDTAARALRGGQSRTRRRLVTSAIVAVAAVGAMAYGVREFGRAQQRLACERLGAQIGTVWNGEVRARVAAGVVATGLPFADTTLEALTRRLDEYVDDWQGTRTQACLDTELDARWDDDTADKVQWCLARQATSVAAFLATLADADPIATRAAMPTVLTLVDAADCVDPAALARMPVPPALHLRGLVAAREAELASVRVLMAAGEYRDAHRRARAVRARAEALGWVPLTTAALELESAALVQVGQTDAGARRAEQAYELAFQTGQWPTAVTAAARLVYIAGAVHKKPKLARAWASHGRVALALSGEQEGALHALHAVAFGQALQAVGATEESEVELRRALTLRESIAGEHHPSVARVLVQLGSMLNQVGRGDEAMVALERAIAIERASLGNDHPAVGRSLVVLGSAQSHGHRHADARDTNLEALSLLRPALGSAHPAVAKATRNLAVDYFRLGQLDEAEALLRHATELVKSNAIGDRTETAMSLRVLGAIKNQQGEFAEALNLYERAIALYESLKGNHDGAIALILPDVENLLIRQRRFGEALRVHDRELSLNIGLFGPDHPTVAEGYAYRAWTKNKMGDLPGALDDATRALALAEVSLGPENIRLANILGCLVEVQTARGQLVEAEAAARRSLAIKRKVYGAEHPEIGTGLLVLGDVLTATERAPEGIRLMFEAAEIFDLHDGEQPNESQTHWLLAQALEETGGDLAVARRQAQLARDGWTRAASTDRAAEVEAWLAAHPLRR